MHAISNSFDISILPLELEFYKSYISQEILEAERGRFMILWFLISDENIFDKIAEFIISIKKDLENLQLPIHYLEHSQRIKSNNHFSPILWSIMQFREDQAAKSNYYQRYFLVDTERYIYVSWITIKWYALKTWWKIKHIPWSSINIAKIDIKNKTIYWINYKLDKENKKMLLSAKNDDNITLWDYIKNKNIIFF